MASLASALFYAITGMGWWSPINSPNDMLRILVLVLLHMGGLVAGFISLQDALWE